MTAETMANRRIGGNQQSWRVTYWFRRCVEHRNNFFYIGRDSNREEVLTNFLCQYSRRSKLILLCVGKASMKVNYTWLDLIVNSNKTILFHGIKSVSYNLKTHFYCNSLLSPVSENLFGSIQVSFVLSLR